MSLTDTQTSSSFFLAPPPLFCLVDLNASSLLPGFTSWRCEYCHKECQKHKIFCFMVGVASATVLHNFLSSFHIASKGHVAVYYPIWPVIQLRGMFRTILSVSWVVIMRFSKRYGSVLVRKQLPETLYFRMVWKKNVRVGVAFQLCFGICHEEGTRKQGGNKMNWTRQLLV